MEASSPARVRLSDASRVQVWRDLSDVVCAYGHAGPAWWAMAWPGIATYRFGPAVGAEVVEAHVEIGVAPSRVEDIYRRGVLPLALQALGRETLHASAVATSRGVLAFCGERRSGKSTVAFGLRRRGLEQHADDTLVLDIGPSIVETVPLPFVPRLRDASAHFFDTTADGSFVSPARDPHTRPLDALFVMRPADGAARLSVEPLRSTEAFRAVLAHAHCFEPDNPDVRRRLVQHYLDLCAVVPVFEVRYAPDLARFDAMLDRILSAAKATDAAVVTA